MRTEDCESCRRRETIANAWKSLAQSLLRIVATELEKTDGPPSQWSGSVDEAWSQLEAAWQTDDRHVVAPAAIRWLMAAHREAGERRKNAEWIAFVAGLPPELQAVAGVTPAGWQAEAAAATFEIAAEHGYDLYLPPDPPKEA